MSERKCPNVTRTRVWGPHVRERAGDPTRTRRSETDREPGAEDAAGASKGSAQALRPARAPWGARPALQVGRPPLLSLTVSKAPGHVLLGKHREGQTLLRSLKLKWPLAQNNLHTTEYILGWLMLNPYTKISMLLIY